MTIYLIGLVAAIVTAAFWVHKASDNRDKL
jgi:hypothetical protein